MANATQTATQRKIPLSRQTVTDGLTLLLQRRWRELGQAARRFARQGDNDSEALHDLRVAIRRLRSLYRAFSAALQGSHPRLKTLRGFFRETGTARDREVALEWIRQLELPLPWLESRWQQAMAQDQRGLAHLPEGLAELAQQPCETLREDLHDTTLGELAATELEKKLARFRRALKRLCRQWDETRAHRLRIRGKRLRYLLEPFVRQHRPCARAVERLKQLQDLLGDNHDMTVLRSRLKDLRRKEDDSMRARQLKSARRLLKQHQDRLQEDFILQFCGQGRTELLKTLESARLALLPHSLAGKQTPP